MYQKTCGCNVFSHGISMVFTVRIFQQCMCVPRDMIYLIDKIEMKALCY